jgi:hypothetical protein
MTEGEQGAVRIQEIGATDGTGRITHDQRYVYWALGDAITKVRKPRITEVATRVDPRILVEDGSVYWIDRDVDSDTTTIWKRPARSLDPQTPLAVGVHPVHLAMDSEYLYWNEIVPSTREGRILRVRR